MAIEEDIAEVIVMGCAGMTGLDKCLQEKLMNDMLTTEGWVLEEKETIKVIGFETKNEAGDAVLKLGLVELLK